jgi:hypothetical protein
LAREGQSAAKTDDLAGRRAMPETVIDSGLDSNGL